MEEPSTANEENSEASEAEDLLVSDAEDAPSLDQDVVLKIDYNARLIIREAKNENAGDDCDTHFVDKNSFLGHRGSESGFHTSTEDLNVSDDEEKSNSGCSALQDVNLDGMSNSPAKDNPESLSTLNYSHTLFKNKYSTDAEYLSREELSTNMKDNLFRKDTQKSFPPGITVTGLSSRVKMASSAILSTTHKALSDLNIRNVFSNSLLLDEDMHDLHDEQESPPMTCLEFLKSELSDGNNTDAEDVSVGSLGDIEEVSRTDKNISEKACNTLGIPQLTDSRRSSIAEFHTEDETFAMDSIPCHSRKRVKKRNFRIADRKEDSKDSGTDEEIL